MVFFKGTVKCNGFKDIPDVLNRIRNQVKLIQGEIVQKELECQTVEKRFLSYKVDRKRRETIRRLECLFGPRYHDCLRLDKALKLITRVSQNREVNGEKVIRSLKGKANCLISQRVIFWF